MINKNITTHIAKKKKLWKGEYILQKMIAGLQLAQAHSHIIALAILIGLGLFLRLSHYQEQMHWGDNARDLLIAKRMVEENKIYLLQPIAGGFHNAIKNSYLYYPLVIPFFLVSKTAVGANLVFCVFAFVSSMILVYLLVKKIFDKDTALITAGFISFSAHSILLISQWIFQPNFLGIFFLLFLYLLYIYIQRPTLKKFLLVLSTFFLCLHIHLSILLLLPTITGWFVYSTHQLIKNTQEKIRILFFITLSVFANLFIYEWGTSNISRLMFFLKNIPTEKIATPLSHSLNFTWNYWQKIELLINQIYFPFPSSYPVQKIIIFFLVISISFFSCYFFPKQRKSYIFLLSFFSPYFLLIILPTSFLSLDWSYLVPFYFLGLILAAAAIKQIEKISFLISLAFCILIGLLIHFDYYAMSYTSKTQPLQRTYEIAQSIYKNNVNRSLPQLFILHDDWTNPTIRKTTWYVPRFAWYLEEMYESPVMSIDVENRSGNNLRQIAKKGSQWYLVCENYPSEEIMIKECISPVVFRPDSRVKKNEVIFFKEYLEGLSQVFLIDDSAVR